jgi:hypothetical protein
VTSGPSSEAAVIAYEQADRALREQAGVLDDARRRARFLTVLISGVATFLGGATLGHEVSPTWVNVFAAVPLALFAAGLWTAVAVVLPTRNPQGAFQFAASAKAILDLEESSPDGVRKEAALGLEQMWELNKPVIEVYWGKLRRAATFLMAQVLSWSALLVVKEMI